jgi:hypothetical protein
MKVAGILSILLLAAFTVATWTSEASAQPAGWAAAAARCRAKAQAQYPVTESDSFRRNRGARYRACMFNAGYRP